MRLFGTSIALAIVGNVLYHLAQKSIPAAASPLESLLVAYGIAFFATALLAIAFPRSPVFAGEGSWSLASVGVGLAIVAIELGFLLAYRAGWKIGLGNVVVNAAGAIVLVPAGALLFRERLSLVNVAGIVLCAVGLLLVTRR